MIRWIFLSTCLFLGACKKKDEQPPVVEIESPSALSTFNYQDAIIVTASINDESNLDYVDLELLSGSLQLLQSKRFQVDGKNYNLSAGFDLDDIHYETGQYFIRVSAFDGTNDNSEYLEFSYQGVARQLLDVLYVEGGSQYTVKSMNDGSVLNTVGSDFLDLSVNSYDQLMYTSGRQHANLVAYDLEDNNESWSRQNMSIGGNDWFLGMTYFSIGRELYYGDQDGNKFLVSKSGQSNMVANAVSGFLPEEAGFVGDELVVDEGAVSLGHHSIMTFNETSGTLIQSVSIPFDPQAIYPKSNSEAFVFGHDGTQIRMAIYNLTTNSLWEPYSFGTMDLNEVIQIDSDRLVLLTNSGVDLYTYSSNGSVNISNQVFDKGKFCTTCNSLFLLNSNEIVEMSLQGSTIQTQTISNGVDLDLRYNK